MTSNPGLTVGRRIVRLGLALVGVIAGTAADEFRPAPRFEGPGIPVPPRQTEPWTPPETGLPRFLVAASATLFEQGLADPRGCEYRAIEVGIGQARGGPAGIVGARGWVLPAAGQGKPRFAVAWNGLVYPVVTVGEPADLAAEVAAAVRRPGDVRPAAGFHGFGSRTEASAVSPARPAPVQVCLLLRLGRADLAEAVWAAGTGRPIGPAGARPKRDLTSYGVSYLSIGSDWAWSHFDRAVNAHARGDDALALADARALAAIRPAIEAKAWSMGFPRPNRNDAEGGPTPYLDFLGQLPDLLADHERRAAEPKREPVPPPGGDKAARIAALIRDLDQIDARTSWAQPGGVSLGESLGVQVLIAEGDEAVEPLIEVLRRDNRLTRMVHFGHDFHRARTIRGTHEAAETAIAQILQTSFDAAPAGDDPSARGARGREATAARVAAYWKTYKAVPRVERWYRILADDRAGPSGWLEAARNITEPQASPTAPVSRPLVGLVTIPIPPGQAPLPRAESLRQGHDPTVSALMSRRFDQILQGPEPSGLSPDQACSMAAMLDAWDPQAALPALREASRVCLERSRPTDQGTNQTRQRIGLILARFALNRARSGDPGAFREYADWIRTTSPEGLETQAPQALEPLYRRPGDPTLAEAADWLFNDPKSAWSPLIVKGKANSGYHEAALIASPLVGVPAFRKMLLAALGDRTPAGTAHLAEGGQLQIALESGWSSGRGHDRVDSLAPEVGVKVAFRMADFYAWELSRLDGAPLFELYWPEARREAGLAEMAGFLGRRGDRFAYNEGLQRHFQFDDFPHSRAHPTFPALDHPATREEVDRGLALFSLEGEGTPRVVSLVDRPLKAKWVKLQDFPSIRQPVAPGTGPRTESDQTGRVWQAEEVFRDGQWRRSFGFVGSHVMARVPAEEIEFTDWPFGSGWRLSDGLDATFFGPASPGSGGPQADPGHPPGSPLVMTLRLRNRTGFDRSVPTEFARKEGDRVVSIRRGIDLRLERASPGQGPTRPDDRKWEEVPARSARRFDPNPSARILRPAEAMDAFQVDLNDLFDARKLGPYRVRLEFSRESGVAEGTVREVPFVVGPVEVQRGGQEIENGPYE